eukprot:901721-Rhodomonas_salina.3
MEWIDGVRCTDLDKLKEIGVPVQVSTRARKLSCCCYEWHVPVPFPSRRAAVLTCNGLALALHPCSATRLCSCWYLPSQAAHTSKTTRA